MPITGQHSSKPKGDNGSVNPKAEAGQTTEMTEGPFKGTSTGDNSSMGIVSKA